ncbi:hypothetical protein BGX27_008200 [Mortierella sp. AM989]|nr:hypothetical protein BGX27_008200 [Mortierella sp. AM989]
MRFTIIASVSTLLSLAAVIKAQEASCSAILGDYNLAGNGKYQECYTDQVYNAALVSAGGSPDYDDIINRVCGKPACSPSTLQSATSKYIAACNSSITADATNSGGNILALGKNALSIFFAQPIRESYCAIDASVVVPPPPVVAPPAYCLRSSVANPASRFVSNLAVYLTSGSIRHGQTPFISTNTLDPADVCSKCSQTAISATVDFLSKNLMPSIAGFYTPEFVQYWNKFVPAYNTLCKTSYTQTWPKGTLNETVPGVPTGNPTTPTAALPTANATATATDAPVKTGGAGSMKPAVGVATTLMLVAVALF